MYVCWSVRGLNVCLWVGYRVKCMFVGRLEG